MPKINVKLETAVYQLLKRQAEQEHRTVTACLELILKAHFRLLSANIPKKPKFKQFSGEFKENFCMWLNELHNFNRLNSDGDDILGYTDGNLTYIRASEIRHTDYRSPKDNDGNPHTVYYIRNEYKYIRGQTVWCAVFKDLLKDPEIWGDEDAIKADPVAIAKRRQIINEWIQPRTWTEDAVYKEARKFVNRVTFNKHRPEAYQYAKTHGFLDKLEFKKRLVLE